MLSRNSLSTALSALLLLSIGGLAACEEDSGGESDDGAEDGSSGVGGSSGGSSGQSGGGGTNATGGTAGKAVTPAELERCGLLGKFVIDSAAPEASCSDGAALGDAIEVGIGPDSGPLVHIGDYSVPANLDDCVLSAENCLATTSPDTYVTATLSLERAADGLSGSFDGRFIEYHRLPDCTTRTDFTAVPLAGCALFGTFTPTAEPMLSSGQCSYGWPTSDIVITGSAAGYVVTWDGDDYEPAPLDEAACTLEAKLGFQTLYVYNDVPRTITLTLSLAGDVLTGSITDALMGTSSLGETCSATFSFSAMRATRVETALPRGCDAPFPFICMDGVCEAEKGEGCRTCSSDCACATGLQCLGDSPGLCTQPCNVFLHDCPDGQRCDFLTETFWSDSTPAGCFPAGVLGAGERCSDNADCARGLFCHQSYIGPGDYGLCLPPCSRNGYAPPGAPACTTQCDDAPGSTTAYFGGCLIECDDANPVSCAAPNTFCWNLYTGTEPPSTCAAIPEGGLGEFGGECLFGDPYVPTCEPGLDCHGFNCPVDAETCIGRCTKACSSPDECPASIPACDSRIGVCSPPLPM